MKLHRSVIWAAALALGAVPLLAQPTNEIEALKQQLRQTQEALEKALQEHRQVVDSLSKRIQALEQQRQPPAAGPGSALTNAPAAPPPTAPAQPAPGTAATPVPAPWSPTNAITLGRAGHAYMNLGLDVLLDAGGSTESDPSARLQLGGHDPIKRGFSLPNAELAFDGAVDPYFKGFANIALILDRNNETDIELEEAYLLSTSLPANLQVKAGQFYAAFGRQNPQHPHQWAFVDQPIILNRAFGPDGLRNPGGQLSWLVPLPFFTELGVGVFDGQGSTAFSFRNPGQSDAFGVDRFHGRATLDRNLRGPGDLVYVPRLASSFDLTPEQTLLAGVSAGFGPNDTGSDRRTQIYGLDLYWKWKSSRAQAGFPFVSWQTEALYQIYEAGADPSASLGAETLRDYGFYSEALWGFVPRWVAGLRGDFVTGNRAAFDPFDVYRGQRTRISPNLTWYITEFSKVRLQYNYDHGQYFGDQHSVWLQLEFMLGAHAAHKF